MQHNTNSTSSIEIMAYASSGREFEVMAGLADLGVTYWHGKRIEFERRGKSRIAEPYEYPALPNYLHISAPWGLMSDIMNIQHLSRTLKFMHATDVRGWHRFQAAADARLFEAQATIAERERMAAANASRSEIINLIAQYKTGEAIMINNGAFAGMLATFGRMVVKPGETFPMVEGNVQLFGRETPVTIDPIYVRKVG